MSISKREETREPIDSREVDSPWHMVLHFLQDLSGSKSVVCGQGLTTRSVGVAHHLHQTHLLRQLARFV
jgi:hypothetical protein